MDYFYCPPEKISEGTLVIDGEEFAHLAHVMRKKEGDEIRVVDGLGSAYDCRLSTFKRHMVHATIFHSYHQHNEPSINVTLGVGILKNPSKFDFLVEKVTELGVREIIPLLTERTIPRHAKVDRWQKLAIAAMKQSGRSYLPIVRKLTTVNELLTLRDLFDVKLIAHENANGTPGVTSIVSQHHHSVLILIGPEGGFSDDEVQQASGAGFTRLHLGERRLRTETAAIVAAGIFLLNIA